MRESGASSNGSARLFWGGRATCTEDQRTEEEGVVVMVQPLRSVSRQPRDVADVGRPQCARAEWSREMIVAGRWLSPAVSRAREERRDGEMARW